LKAKYSQKVVRLIAKIQKFKNSKTQESKKARILDNKNWTSIDEQIE
jgi:hypothetical protein